RLNAPKKGAQAFGTMGDPSRLQGLARLVHQTVHVLRIRPIDSHEQHWLSPPTVRSRRSTRGSATAFYGTAFTTRLPIGGLRPRRSRGEIVSRRRSSRKERMIFSPRVAPLIKLYSTHT